MHRGAAQLLVHSFRRSTLRVSKWETWEAEAQRENSCISQKDLNFNPHLIMNAHERSRSWVNVQKMKL